MVWTILMVLVLLVLVVVITKLKQTEGRVKGYQYSKKLVLFSPAERSFLGVLDQAVGEEYRIFGKVRVADIVEPQRGLGKSLRQKALNRITAKHFDFVLCTKSDLSVVCAIELDDQSHQQRKRQERDAFLVGLCKAISLPLVQVPAKRTYSVPEVRATVMGALEQQIHAPIKEPGLSQSLADPDVEQANESEVLAGHKVLQEEFMSEVPPPCPKCAAPMVRRQAKTGTNTGQEFWGCSVFPKCRGVIQ